MLVFEINIYTLITTNMRKPFYIVLFTFIFISCNKNKSTFDASGIFEADEVLISSESNGLIKSFNIEEGETLESNIEIGFIDSTQLYLRKKQLLAQIKASGYRLPNIKEQTGFYNSQIEVVQTKLKSLKVDQKRFENLWKAEAISQKKIDDVNSAIEEANKQLIVLQKQQAAQVSALSTQSKAIQNDPMPLYVQIEQVNDQLKKCKIINPLKGTVLIKYAQTFEITTQGKPLYKIADLENITLRSYISGTQLPKIRLNQKVKVFTDNGENDYNVDEGYISWISSKAEFTPKTIQTKAERTNLVYAIKIKLKNKGNYKIGMYAEVNFL